MCHSRAQNPRITSGLGVIPRVVSNARAIYRGKLSKPEALARIYQYWFPYHRALQRLLSRAHACFGYSLLIDMHSMPHEAVAHLGKPNQGIDVVLGDRYGASADIALGDLIEQAFETHKFVSVAMCLSQGPIYTTIRPTGPIQTCGAGRT